MGELCVCFVRGWRSPRRSRAAGLLDSRGDRHASGGGYPDAVTFRLKSDEADAGCNQVDRSILGRAAYACDVRPMISSAARFT
jgi:hypothetical protein